MQEMILPIAHGVATKEVVDRLYENKTLLELEKIEGILYDLSKFLKTNTLDKEAGDAYRVTCLNKKGSGNACIINPGSHKHIRVFSTVALPISVESIIGSPFTVTIPAPALPTFWIPLDFPDGTQVYLDTTASVSQANIYIRYTNQRPS